MNTNDMWHELAARSREAFRSGDVARAKHLASLADALSTTDLPTESLRGQCELALRGSR